MAGKLRTVHHEEDGATAPVPCPRCAVQGVQGLLGSRPALHLPLQVGRAVLRRVHNQVWWVIRDQYYTCLLFSVADSSESMCPTKLANEDTLEASEDPQDWGVCSKDCNLKHYKSNQQIYDQVCGYEVIFLYRMHDVSRSWS